MPKDIEHQYAIGDIVIAPFPFADRSTIKLRPAIIVSKLAKQTYLVVYITSSKESKTAFDVILKPTKTNNLLVSSVARINRMTVVAESMISRLLGKITASERKKVASKLAKIQKDFLK